MDSDPTSWVHIGSWTDWSQGTIKGSKVTVTETGAAYLIAFLALFVRFAGQHSWSILCFLVFQYRRRHHGNSHEAYRVVTQSIFRNTGIDSTAAWQFLSLLRHRRAHGQHWFSRCLGWSLFATLHALGFAAAGIFVSKVADTGSTQVLLRGPVCGIWQDPSSYDLYSENTEPDLLENNLWSQYIFGMTNKGAEFARQCYNVSSSTSALANCNAYAPSLLRWNITINDQCPFDLKMCNGPTVHLDTGYLSSSTHFGINTEHSEYVTYRRVVRCSPTTRDEYVSELVDRSQVDWPTDSTIGQPLPGSLFQSFNYGVNTVWNMSSTFIWSDASTGTDMIAGDVQGPIYEVGCEIATSECQDCASFNAISELNVTNADTVMLFLIPQADYFSEVHDPWFKATTIDSNFDSGVFVDDNSANNTTAYRSDYNVSVMACTEQFQYCNQDQSQCTPLSSSYYAGGLEASIDSFTAMLNLTSKQNSILNRLAQASWTSDMYYASFGVEGSNLLAAQSSNSIAANAALPDNQWILEMQHYFLLGLTSMQMQLSSFATGPEGSSNYQYLTAVEPEDQWMCNNQLVQRTGYTTFSVLGISIVVVVGAILVLVDLSIIERGAIRMKHVSGTGLDSWRNSYHLQRALARFDEETTIDSVNQGLDRARTMPVIALSTLSSFPEKRPVPSATTDPTVFTNELDDDLEIQDDQQYRPHTSTSRDRFAEHDGSIMNDPIHYEADYSNEIDSDTTPRKTRGYRFKFSKKRRGSYDVVNT